MNENERTPDAVLKWSEGTESVSLAFLVKQSTTFGNSSYEILGILLIVWPMISLWHMIMGLYLLKSDYYMGKREETLSLVKIINKIHSII